MKKLLLTMTCLIMAGMAFANHWTPIGGTQYNMTMNGVIIIDGVEQTGTNLEVGAFCGDECRGSMLPEFFPPTSQYVVALTVVSNQLSGEEITFRLYDHAVGQELNLVSVNNITFVNNAMIGQMNDWYQFAFTTPVTTNTIPGDWNNPTIWGGTLPTPEAIVELGANVTIGEGGATTVTVAGLTIPDGDTLTIEPGSILIVTGNLVNAEEAGLVIEEGAQVINTTPNVKATVKKNIAAYTTKDSDGWYIIASAVNNMAIAGSDFLNPEYDLYRFNETSIGEEWENYKAGISDFTTFENGRGYLYANSNTITPAFTGVLNNADVTYNLTYTDRTDELAGFNLIGNPFSHAIYKGTGGAIDHANLASGFYTLNDEGAWHVHTYQDAIMPGQGILVKTTTPINLNIAKSNAVATSEASGTKENVGLMGIEVTGCNAQDRAYVYFTQGIGLEKLGGFSSVLPSLWIRKENEDFAIAHIDNTYESLDICFYNALNADYTLTVNTKNTNFDYLQLIDKVANVSIDLLQQPEYFFHAEGNEMEARFSLVFRETTGVEENVVATPFAYVHDGQIVLTGAAEKATLQIVDLTGRTVLTSYGQQNVNTNGLCSGVYMLRLVGNDGVKVQKIVIK